MHTQIVSEFEILQKGHRREWEAKGRGEAEFFKYRKGKKITKYQISKSHSQTPGSFSE